MRSRIGVETLAADSGRMYLETEEARVEGTFV